MSDEEVRDVFNIHRLSSEDRWKLYKYWLTKSLAPLQKEIQEREKRYGKAQEHYKNVQQVADIKIQSMYIKNITYFFIRHSGSVFYFVM
jgi:predicted patatin/cPLA2 family phospholipase